jgi:hypothetical protein
MEARRVSYMEQNEESIEIRISYEDSDYFPAKAVAETIGHIDAIVLEQEGRELETLARDLEGIPPLALDATRHRLSLRSGEGVLFYSASQGSIVLCGVVAGLYWILQQTLGETLKDAWIESDLHKKLKRLLLAGSRYKAEAIAQGIEKRHTISLGEQKRVELRANVDTEYGVTIINVHATLHGADLPPLKRVSSPTYGEAPSPQEGGSYGGTGVSNQGGRKGSRQGGSAGGRGEDSPGG